MTTLAELESGTTPQRALELFDSLDPVAAADLSGRWRGRELSTGHPFDGLLTASGWYGKQFDSVDEVHPLLFSRPGGGVFAADPRRVPLGLVGTVPVAAVARGRRLLRVVEPAVRTRRHRARLRMVQHRGVVTAAMVYDHLPIIDIFRRVGEDTVLGVMDLRGFPDPYFFVLERD